MEGAWQVYEPRPARGGARPTRPGWCCAPSAGRPSGFALGIVELLPTARRGHRRRPPRPRPARPRLGRGRGAAPAAAEPDAPGRRGAARPAQPRRASATCTPPSCASSPASTRAPRSARCPTCRRLVRRARQMLDLNKERAVQSTTGDLRERDDVGLPARPAAVPPLRHPDPGRDARAGRAASGRRTGARAASPARRASAAGRPPSRRSAPGLSAQGTIRTRAGERPRERREGESTAGRRRPARLMTAMVRRPASTSDPRRSRGPRARPRQRHEPA